LDYKLDENEQIVLDDIVISDDTKENEESE